MSFRSYKQEAGEARYSSLCRKITHILDVHLAQFYRRSNGPCRKFGFFFPVKTFYSPLPGLLFACTPVPLRRGFDVP